MTMADEPTLPSLPKVSWDSHTQTFTNTRKRNRNSVASQPIFSNSSDPAVFSSDDDPHVDNYVDGRHCKKRYVGSWFQQRPASSDSTYNEAVAPQPKPNRAFERQQDSGVWMGSDGSVDPDEEFNIEIGHAPESKLPQLHGYWPRPTATSEAAIVRTRIELAIEEGNPEIDLSSLRLTDIPKGTLSQLEELVLIPSVDKDVPFEQSNPQLGLYLSNNTLTRAPGDLFNLEHLTYLSLRNNQLSELPPSISRLRNLRELNISLNCLRYLPGELLSLLRYPSALSSLHIHPNPFYRPEGGFPPHLESDHEIDDEKNQDVHMTDVNVATGINPSGDHSTIGSRRQSLDARPKCSWKATLRARSLVQYSDSRGLVLSKFRLPCQQSDNHSQSKENEKEQHVTIPTEDVSQSPVPDFHGRFSEVPPPSSPVLSLFELALKSASRAAQTWDLASNLPPEVPSSLLRSIERIAVQSAANGNSGTLPCSICGRQTITPIAQWIEWWDISKQECAPDGSITFEPLSMDASENAIPFLKRGCSQICVPKPMSIGQLAPGALLTR